MKLLCERCREEIKAKTLNGMNVSIVTSQDSDHLYKLTLSDRATVTFEVEITEEVLVGLDRTGVERLERCGWREGEPFYLGVAKTKYKSLDHRSRLVEYAEPYQDVLSLLKRRLRLGEELPPPVVVYPSYSRLLIPETDLQMVDGVRRFLSYMQLKRKTIVFGCYKRKDSGYLDG